MASNDTADRHKSEMEQNRKTFHVLRTAIGLDNKVALQAAFALVDSYIGLYLLNEADALLSEILPSCKKVDPMFQAKGLQAAAFILFKQQRFREAVEMFEQFEKLSGKSSTLSENMGHCYNALGDHINAEVL